MLENRMALMARRKRTEGCLSPEFPSSGGWSCCSCSGRLSFGAAAVSACNGSSCDFPGASAGAPPQGHGGYVGEELSRGYFCADSQA